MKKRWNLPAVLALALCASGITFVLTYSAMNSDYNAVLTAAQQSLSRNEKLSEIEAYLDHYFVGDLDETKLQDAAAEGLIDGTGDRWSYYVSAEDYESYEEQMNNAYVGIGITIAWNEDENAYEVMQVTTGGPAEQAGMQVGDFLLSVDGTDCTDLELSDIKEKVRGEAGTDVVLTVRSEGEVTDLTVTRASVTVDVASYELLDDGCGLVTIRNFDTNCANQTIDAIEALRGMGATSIIFDVRNNPGGMKTELVKLLDYLLPEGTLFRSKDYAGNETTDYSDADYLDMPMAVIVNADTYSAAEFFAAALQEYGAATIVGEKTVGKGYFQNTFRLSDGSAIAISTGEYFTPNGVSLAGVGVTPDVQVALDDEDAEKLYYGQLDRADDDQLIAAQDALDLT